MLKNPHKEQSYNVYYFSGDWAGIENPRLLLTLLIVLLDIR